MCHVSSQEKNHSFETIWSAIFAVQYYTFQKIYNSAHHFLIVKIVGRGWQALFSEFLASAHMRTDPSLSP
jgi:hypothetical protein